MCSLADEKNISHRIEVACPVLVYYKSQLWVSKNENEMDIKRSKMKTLFMLVEFYTQLIGK